MSLEIGDDTFVGHEVLITGGSSSIRIGKCVDIAPRAIIVSGGHEIDMKGSHSAGEGWSRDITIEDGAWIGAGTIVMGGVTIGRKSIIGAGSVVTQSLPPYVVAVGSPCRPIKRWDVASETWHPITSSERNGPHPRT